MLLGGKMAKIRSFKAVMPSDGNFEKVAALPYDVYSKEEAREVVKGKEKSFLNLDRAEVYFDESTSPYEDKVYAKAREEFYKWIDEGTFEVRKKAEFYIYELIMDGRSQVGLVAAASVDDYENNIIKKHEKTRADKEEDRIRHVDSLDANTGPIFLTYRNRGEISEIINDYKNDNVPLFDFVADDGITHRGWAISDELIIEDLTKKFADIDYLYIADGHHRAASAVKVAKLRREQNPAYTGEEEFNFFLSVIFPDNELKVMDYNRVIKDLNGNNEEEFLAKIREKFEVVESSELVRPDKRHSFGMYLGEKWYKIRAKFEICFEDDVVRGLDVSILQENVLDDILGIKDPKTDKRIDFIGGIRGLKEIERRCKEDGFVLGFSMYPTSIDELMAVADVDLLMPPKSTWFEPKLRSGLFIHLLK